MELKVRSEFLVVLLFILPLPSMQQSPVGHAHDKDFLQCSEDEMDVSQNNHIKCINQVQERLRTGAGGLGLGVICQHMDEQVNKCGEHLNTCLKNNDLRILKDVQIEAFVKVMEAQKLGDLAKECDIVQEYKRSGRKPYKRTELCDVEQVGKVLDTRDTCVRDAKNTMRSRVRVIRTKAELDNTICEFVEKSLYDCNHALKRCYGEDEFQHMMASATEALDEILAHLGSVFDLDSCTNLPNALESTSASAQISSNSLMTATILLALTVIKVFIN